jgi:hypothetical protein
MKELRDYQIENSKKGAEILNKLKIVYYAMQVRTGKTATALNTCKINQYKKVLFLTKKKAISSINEDYKDFAFNNYFELLVSNNESLHLIKDKDFDCVIMDEAHRFGSFPKPSKGCKDFKLRFCNLPLILLSGTPTPESYSQIYHQLYISNYTPFKEFSNFYKWSKQFVLVKQKNLGFGLINDYSQANNEFIKSYTDKYIITYTQEQAKFTSVINEHVIYCEMNEVTLKICKRLIKDLIIEGSKEIILADTAVKLQQKLHQLYSGTVKFESGNSKVIDYSKALFMANRFDGNKIAIFYKFKEELNALKFAFQNTLTTDLDEFNSTNKNIALQIVSGREGISLKNAKYLVYYNIDFSAVSYWQSRDRLTTMERSTNDIYWLFSKGGIEEKIYKSVMNKKDYTLSVFRKDYGIKKTN